MFVYRMVFWEDPKLSQVCVCVRVCVCVCGVFFRSPTSQEKQELVAETWCKEGPVKKTDAISVFTSLRGSVFQAVFFQKITSIKTLQLRSFHQDHVGSNKLTKNETLGSTTG